MLEFTEEIARSSLNLAAFYGDFAVEPAELVRIGSNAVFRLPDRVVARVASNKISLEDAKRQICVAKWLARVDYPAVRALDIRQPLEAEGRVVTVWVSINRNEVFAPIDDVAALIRRLHDLGGPEFALPALMPFGGIDDPIAEFSGLSADAADFLMGRIVWAREEFPRLPFALPQGPIHGDANVGNVLQDEEGNAILIDLDSFAVGPREWDLIQTALFYDRLGWHTEEEYRTFVEVYGYDIMQWSGYETLADMREVAMVSWLSQKAHESEATAREAEKRVRAMMTGASRRDWGAY